MSNLARCKGLAVKGFMPRPGKQRAQVSAEQWTEHVSNHYSGGIEAEPVQPDAEASNRAKDFTAPSLPDFLKLVRSAIGRLDEASAAGIDGLPAAFIKHATQVDGDNPATTTHLLAPLIARLFHTAFTTCKVPKVWKEARLTPLFKKDDPTVPANYRLLAVSSVLYRLYTSCVCTLLTKWCQRQGVMPDHQFGFYPKRNVQQAQFVLRHVVQGRKQWGRKQGEGRHVWAAFIDFQAAYDHVDRRALWAHLEHRVGVPAAMLHAVRSLYEADAYVLHDGATITPPVHPVKGVKQGCPLSPILFALFLNDIASSLEVIEPGTEPVGVPLGPAPHAQQSYRISHVMFADDLTLLAGSREQVQVLVDRLSGFALRKGLVVNVKKCAIMSWPSQPGEQPVHYRGQAVPYVNEFKFLGMWIDSRFSMGHASDKQRGAVMAAWHRVLSQAIEHGLRNMPHAMLHLVQTYVLPAALFGSQVWGPDLLSTRSLYTSSLQKALNGVYRQILQVKGTVCAASLLDEVGVPPLPCYWLKAAVGFWSQAHKAQNELLTQVLNNEWELGKVCSSSWSAKLRRFLSRDLACDAFPAEGEPVTPHAMLCVNALNSHIQAQREEVNHDPRLPDTQHRARATYVHWFGMPVRAMKGVPRLHPYLCAGAQVPAPWVGSMARLRLSDHALRVQSGRIVRPPLDYGARKCTRCDISVVDDEYHLLLECGATAAIRRSFADVVPQAGLPAERMRMFMRQPAQRDSAPDPEPDNEEDKSHFTAVRRRSQFVHECMLIADAKPA